MSALWTITDPQGVVLCPCFETPSLALKPKDCGWPYDEAQLVFSIPARPDPASTVFDFEAGTWVDDLAVLRERATAKVNDDAESFRMKFLTPGAGQAATYLRKETEAREWVSGDDPATAPFLACEAASTDMTIDAVAALVVAQADAWVVIGSGIEGLRRGASMAIVSATTKEAIVAASVVDWQSLLR